MTLACVAASTVRATKRDQGRFDATHATSRATSWKLQQESLSESPGVVRVVVRRADAAPVAAVSFHHCQARLRDLLLDQRIQKIEPF